LRYRYSNSNTLSTWRWYYANQSANRITERGGSIDIKLILYNETNASQKLSCRMARLQASPLHWSCFVIPIVQAESIVDITTYQGGGMPYNIEPLDSNVSLRYFILECIHDIVCVNFYLLSKYINISLRQTVCSNVILVCNNYIFLFKFACKCNTICSLMAIICRRFFSLEVFCSCKSYFTQIHCASKR